MDFNLPTGVRLVDEERAPRREGLPPDWNYRVGTRASLKSPRPQPAMDMSQPGTGAPPPPPPPPGRYCPHCGTPLGEGWVLCPSCGRRPEPGHPNTSGQGRDALVPPEIDRWNWGAFFLGWIWGLGNRVYISLLSLIPIVGVVMAFVLGAKGSEWAWRNKTWPSIERFKTVQRQWTVAGLIVWGGLVSLGIAGAVLAPEPGEEALTKTLVSDDARLSIQVPSSWVEADRLFKGASLQAEHEFEELYVVVVMNEAVDLDPSVGLRAFARLAREGILDSLEKGRVNSGPVDLTIGGRHVVQVEFEGAADSVGIVYVHTSIEVPEGFVEVIAWTLPSLIDETRSLLKSISGSVRFQP
jgi:zinc-ribbon domain